MPLTVTARPSLEDVHGRIRHTVRDCDFDTSYPDGGEALTARTLGLAVVEECPDVAVNGHVVHYDITNALLQVFKQGPPVRIEASGTIVAGATYTLRYLPGYVLGVRVTAGGVTGAFRVIPTGETPATTEVALNWTTGVMTFLAGDAVTALTVVYIPRHVPGFTTNLLTIDEVVDVTTDSGNLAARAAAICCVWDDSNNNPLTIVPVGEAPGAGACAIDMNNGGNTTITVNAAGTTDSLKVTYLEFAGNPLTAGANWVDQADRTVTSNAVSPATDATFDVNGIVLPGFGQVIVGETGAAGNLQSLMVDPSGTAAANVCVWNPSRNSITFAAGDAYATAEIPLLYFSDELHGSILQEVAEGEDLSWLTSVRLHARGF